MSLANRRHISGVVRHSAIEHFFVLDSFRPFARRQGLPLFFFNLTGQICWIGLNKAFLGEKPKMLIGTDRQNVRLTTIL
ncbi:MAG: hypothetical protein OIF54_08615 [Cohaesibacter sp.]|nr:hypothetical protein [Cohaesibacter sp.]